jgi:hypothetical protein
MPFGFRVGIRALERRRELSTAEPDRLGEAIHTDIANLKTSVLADNPAQAASD